MMVAKKEGYLFVQLVQGKLDNQLITVRGENFYQVSNREEGVFLLPVDGGAPLHVANKKGTLCDGIDKATLNVGMPANLPEILISTLQKKVAEQQYTFPS